MICCIFRYRIFIKFNTRNTFGAYDNSADLAAREISLKTNFSLIHAKNIQAAGNCQFNIQKTTYIKVCSSLQKYIHYYIYLSCKIMTFLKLEIYLFCVLLT